MAIDPGVQAGMLRLEMIARAREAGVSWRAIGAASGEPDPKAAKAAAKKLIRTMRKRAAREGATNGSS